MHRVSPLTPPHVYALPVVQLFETSKPPVIHLLTPVLAKPIV
jgi:hypothetical protein